MTSRHSGPPLALSVVIGFALGFYVALIVVALVFGEDAFNAAFPNPWRLAICLPGLVSTCALWVAVTR